MSGTLGELGASFGKRVAKSSVLARFNCNEAHARSKVAAPSWPWPSRIWKQKRLRKLDAVGDIEVSMANTEVLKADGARAMGEAQSSYCLVTAPFSGHVAKVHVKPFQTVSAGTRCSIW
jgi:multidrug resistance efflux pump